MVFVSNKTSGSWNFVITKRCLLLSVIVLKKVILLEVFVTHDIQNKNKKYCMLYYLELKPCIKLHKFIPKTISRMFRFVEWQKKVAKIFLLEARLNLTVDHIFASPRLCVVCSCL